MQEEKKPNTPLVNELVNLLSRPSHTDPNGSWTGVPADTNETPVQDADDL